MGALGAWSTSLDAAAFRYDRHEVTAVVTSVRHDSWFDARTAGTTTTARFTTAGGQVRETPIVLDRVPRVGERITVVYSAASDLVAGPAEVRRATRWSVGLIALLAGGSTIMAAGLVVPARLEARDRRAAGGGVPRWRTSWAVVALGAFLAVCALSLAWFESHDAVAFRAETRRATAVVDDRGRRVLLATWTDAGGVRHESEAVDHPRRHRVGDTITVEYSPHTETVVEAPAAAHLMDSARREALLGAGALALALLGHLFPAWLRHLDRHDGIALDPVPPDPEPSERFPDPVGVTATTSRAGRRVLTTAGASPPGATDLALRDILERVLATRPPGAASVEHSWGPVTRMWTTEVRPAATGADGLRLRYDGVAQVLVVVGGGRVRRFDAGDLAGVERLLRRVVAGRGWRRKGY